MRFSGARLAVLPGLLAALLTTPAVADDAEPSNELRLQTARFDPVETTPDLPQRLRFAVEPVSGYFVVQFERTIDGALLRRVRGLGIETLSYLPDRAYLVRIPPGRKNALESLPGVRWIGSFQPGWKLSPDLERVASAGRIDATIDLHPGEALDRVVRLAAETGAEIVARWSYSDTRRLKVRATSAQLERIATLPAVAWIEPAAEITLRNDTTRWVVQTDVPDSVTVWDHGLHGEGQIIGHIDSRIDLDSCFFRDENGNAPGPDHRKVVAYRSSTGVGGSAHGTHTAGSAAGDQLPLNGTVASNGLAFAARLAHANLADIDGSGTAASNLYQYLSLAHGDGARVHTNSWGDDGTRFYTTWTRDVDRFAHDFEDSLVVFAVSNQSTVRTPENAKNALAVSASLNGLAADGYCAGGEGPTLDGRRKPEIVAPGCGIVSARNADCATRTLSGTSFAAPTIAAAGALVRQYFEQGRYPGGEPLAADALAPSGALVKATLLNSTVDMADVEGHPNEIEGWGRVLLDDALYFRGDLRRLSVLADRRNVEGLSTGEQAAFDVEVTDPAESLRVTLVFTEPPAALFAGLAAVNNLDLRVTSPTGLTYPGNSFDGSGASRPRGAADRINNVEMVYLTDPEPGNWAVEVIGTAVNEGLQGFALVASGALLPRVPGKLSYAGHVVNDSGPLGNGDGIPDPGETITVPLTLRNRIATTTRETTGRIRSREPNAVTLTGGVASFPDIESHGTQSSLMPHYRMTVRPETACGSVVPFDLEAEHKAGRSTSSFDLVIGRRTLSPLDLPRTIPFKTLTPVVSTITVTESFPLADVRVGVDIAHEQIDELAVRLVSPSGTRVTLHEFSGAIVPDLRAIYGLDALPDGPGDLADLVGESAAGTWRLEVSDPVGGEPITTPTGTLVGWSLALTPAGDDACSPLDCDGDPVPGVVPPRMTLVPTDDTAIVFDWPPVAGAGAYRVWRSTAPDFAAAEIVGVTNGTSLAVSGQLDRSASWYYRVRAINSCEWEGP